MSFSSQIKSIGVTVATIMIFVNQDPTLLWAQDSKTASAAAEASQSEPLSAEELETLVARIALYPDDLVALVLASALYPLQLVQADRYLSEVKSKPKLKPDADWDGSIIALLNYPDVISMMNDDLKWTEQLGAAVVNQQKDLLEAIQELRDRALAKGVIKSDSKVTIQEQNDNVIITPVKQEATYVPKYDPVILSPTYVYEESAPPPVYYGDPYPSYYYPYAPYWPGFFTGMFWGAAIDWDNWHSWGGDVDVDVDIDIDNIGDRVEHWDRNNFNNLNWDRDKFKFDRDSINSRLRENGRDRLDRKGNRNRVSNLPAGGNRLSGNDVRRDVQRDLKKQGQRRDKAADRKAGQGRDRAGTRPSQGANRAGNRPSQGAKNAQRKQGGARNRSAQRPAGKVDRRPKQMSGLGDYGRGRSAKQFSQRGQFSRSGRGGYGGGPKIRRPAGGGGRGFGGGGGGRGFGGGGRGGGRRR